MYIPVSNTWPYYLETVEQKNRVGYLVVAIPGALKSWCYLEAGYGAPRLGHCPAAGHPLCDVGYFSQYLARYYRPS